MAEVSGVVASVAFVTTTIVLSIVFSAWGFPFSAVASPNDVISYSVGLMSQTALTLAAAAGTYVWLDRSGRDGPSRRALICTCAAILFVGSLALLSWLYSATKFGGMLAHPVLEAFATGMPFGLLGRIALTLRQPVPPERSARLKLAWCWLLTLGMALISGYAFIWMSIEQRITWGFADQELASAAAEVQVGAGRLGCTGSVFWVGERSTVIRCEDPTVLAGTPPHNVSQLWLLQPNGQPTLVSDFKYGRNFARELATSSQQAIPSR